MALQAVGVVTVPTVIWPDAGLGIAHRPRLRTLREASRVVETTVSLGLLLGHVLQVRDGMAKAHGRDLHVGLSCTWPEQQVCCTQKPLRDKRVDWSCNDGRACKIWEPLTGDPGVLAPRFQKALSHLDTRACTWT